MAMKKRVDILIPIWNELAYTKICISSIVGKTDPELYNLILVDNGSDEETADWLRNFAMNNKNVFLIRHEENTGYVGGVNSGVQLARSMTKSEYIAVITNDTVCPQNWLDMLAHMEEDKQIGIVGPTSNNVAARQHVSFNNGTYKKEFVEYLIGLFYIIRADVVDQLITLDGFYLDEIFNFGSSDDLDLSIRVRKMGYKLLIDRTVYVHHFLSKSLIKVADEKKVSLDELHRDYFQILQNKHGAFPKQREPYILIGVPTYGLVDHRFWKTSMMLNIPYKHGIETMPRMMVDQARNKLAQTAIDYGFTHLLVCFKGDTLIETEIGGKRIKDVKVGDRVKTHKGVFRKVTKTYKRKYEQGRPIVWVSTGNSLTKATPEHPFYILRNGLKHWESAENLKIGDCLLYPKDGQKDHLKFDCFAYENKDGNRKYHKYHGVVNIKKHTNRPWQAGITVDGTYKVLGYFDDPIKAESAYIDARKKSKDYFGDFEVDKDFARFMGLYLAEGCGGHDGIRFTFNNNEHEYHKFIVDFCRNKFNRNPTIHTRWATTIKLNLKTFANLFTDWFGKDAVEKRIPDFVFRWNLINKLAFIQGYIEGDGSANGLSCVIATASKTLASDYVRLCKESGLQCSEITFSKGGTSIIAGNKVISKGSYHVNLYKKSYEKLLDLIESDHDNEHYLIPIRHIETTKQSAAKDGHVYNLEVDVDNTYIANSGIVHNCDDDMIYDDPDIIIKLVEHNVDIVGVRAYTRSAPHYPCVFYRGGNSDEFYQEVDFSCVGLREVDALGMSMCLINVDVFRKTPEPWFEFGHVKVLGKGDDRFGEDLYFCKKAKEAGFKVHCDTNIEIAHIGENKIVTRESYHKITGKVV